MTEWIEIVQQLPMETLIALMGMAVTVALIAAQEAVGMGCIAWVIGQIKGRPDGFAWGLWLGLIGVVVVIFRRDRKNANETDNDDPPARPDALELMEADSKMWFCPGCGSARPSKEDFCPCGVRKTSYVRPEQEVVQEAIEEQEVPEEKSKMAFVMGELMKFFPVLPMEKELSKLIWSILFYIYVSPIIFAGVNMAVSSVLGLTLILALLTPLTSVVVNLVGTAYAVLGVVFSIMYYIGRRFE